MIRLQQILQQQQELVQSSPECKLDPLLMAVVCNKQNSGLKLGWDALAIARLFDDPNMAYIIVILLY